MTVMDTAAMFSSPGIQPTPTARSGVRSLRLLGLVLILLIVLAGTFFAMSSVSVNFRYLAILVALVAAMTMFIFVCRMATGKQICFPAGCCKTQAGSSCRGRPRPRPAEPQPDWSTTMTGPHSRLDTELIRDLRKTESHLLGLLFIINQLSASGADSDARRDGHDQELIDLLTWYVRTEYTVLSSWMEGRSPCTRDDVTRMRCRLGFMCSQGPLAIGARSQAHAPACPVEASYEQWLTITRRWLATLRENASRGHRSSTATLEPVAISQDGAYHNDSFVRDSPSGSFAPPVYSRMSSMQSFDILTYAMMEPPPYEEMDPNNTPYHTPISSLPGSGAMFPIPGYQPLTPVTSPAMTSSPAATSGLPPPYCELGIADLSPIAENPFGDLPSILVLDEAPPPYDALLSSSL